MTRKQRKQLHRERGARSWATLYFALFCLGQFVALWLVATGRLAPYGLICFLVSYLAIGGFITKVKPFVVWRH